MRRAGLAISDSIFVVVLAREGSPVVGNEDTTDLFAASNGIRGNRDLRPHVTPVRAR